MMQLDSLLVTRQGPVLLAQLDRPKRRNALNMGLIAELSGCLTEFSQDDSLLALVICGDEVAFCAGQDLKEPEPADFLDKLNALLAQIENCNKTTIAAIGGWCIAGGLELAMACDMRVASNEAKIGDWHAKINSLGGAGAIVRLPQLVGMAFAKEMMLTGDVLDGHRACAIGLVNQTHPADQYAIAALDLAERCAKINPLTTARIKETLRFVPDLPKDRAIELSLVNQNRLLADLSVDIIAEYKLKKTEGI